jgi:1,4-dihydroxy-2-naphthoyl-CoA hydrolase
MTDFNEILNDRGRGALDKKMGIEITEASPQRLVGRMPVEGNTQPFGLLHGGANVVLAESLGSVGTHVTAVATAVTLGKTLCTYNVEITNDKGEKTCTARITCLILAQR